MYKNITNIQPILFEDKDNDQLTTIQQMKRQGGGGWRIRLHQRQQ